VVRRSTRGSAGLLERRSMSCSYVTTPRSWGDLVDEWGVELEVFRE
jgi:hypothetical protein